MFSGDADSFGLLCGARRFGVFVALATLVGCSNGRGSVGTPNEPEPQPQEPPTQFLIGGSVSGLEGTGLVLQNNGTDDLEVSTDGAITFADPLDNGSSYNVSVLTQPTDPEQTCAVSNGSGTVTGADVTDVTVVCTNGVETRFSVGGVVNGLLGSGLVLQNNDGDDLAIDSNGNFTFSGTLVVGDPYNVTIAAQPSDPVQTCTVSGAAGVIGENDVTDVSVTCATDVFNVGGVVQGLAGSGLVLQLNAGNDRAISNNGRYEFPIALPSGTAYVVSILTQPSNPTQACSVENASGVVGDRSIDDVNVICEGQSFTIGGTVTGLEGSGLALLLNGGNELPIASNGSFTFASPLVSGSTYDVTIGAQPDDPSQTCTVSGASGTVGAGNVRTVRVTCATDTFSVGGSVNGLLGSGLVLENSGDRIEVESDGSFVFPTRVASGGSYAVAVRTQPSEPTQSCTVTNGAGTVGGANIANVEVSCTTSEFMVGGIVSGLAGSGLVLRNNGGDDLSITADGSFTFPTALVSGGTYAATIAAQPSGPTQECTLENASGVVGGGNVTSIRVNCVTIEYTVGGTVSGLLGAGLALTNNGADTLNVAAAGPFTFSDSLPSGTPYDVAVSAQPAQPTQECTVSNGVGTVSDANVTNVAVNCVTSTFTVSVSVSNLRGFNLRVANNGTDQLNISTNGTHTFAVPVASGEGYSVSVIQQPTLIFGSQVCSVQGGSGTVGGQPVTVAVTCD